MSKPTFIDRPPRIQPELPIGEHQIPRPPSHPQRGAQQLIEIGLPMVTIIGYILVSVFAGGSGSGALLLIPMAASLFGIDNATAIQVVGVGFIIGVLQDSAETALNSSTDVLFTAAGSYKPGDPYPRKLPREEVPVV